MYYVQDNGGISLESDYPYVAVNDLCLAEYNGPVSVSKVNHVQTGSQD